MRFNRTIWFLWKPSFKSIKTISYTMNHDPKRLLPQWQHYIYRIGLSKLIRNYPWYSMTHMIWPFAYRIVYRTDGMGHWQGSKSICRNELISSSDSVFQNSRLVCCRSKIGCLKTILMIFGRNTRRWNFWACHSKKCCPKCSFGIKFSRLGTQKPWDTYCGRTLRWNPIHQLPFS